MPVAAAAEKIIASLQAAGVVIVPVAANSNYLSASMINVPAPSDSVIQLLQKLQPQIIWMKADYLPATEQLVKAISSLSNLSRLSWAHGKLTDKYLPAFQSLSQIQYLNLSNNPISRDALLSLQSLPKLQSLYIWNTKIVGNEIAALTSAFPHTQLDTGNYRLAMIAADTIPVKAPPVK
jgi:Leucine-rich repeat (LRR) protein